MRAGGRTGMQAKLLLAAFCAAFLSAPPRSGAEPPSVRPADGQPNDPMRPEPGSPALSGQTNLSRELGWPSPVDDQETNTFLLSELLEAAWSQGDAEARWDVFGWSGGDYNRLWVKTEGGATDSAGDADFQLLYGRMVSRFFDFQVGLRVERSWRTGSDRSRSLGAIGVQGLAPYYFDLEPTLFVSQDGEVSGRVTGTYDLFITQRLILQPRLEGVAAVQDQEEFGMGSGMNNVEAGLRLRYEIRREFGPYIGLNFAKRYGETAALARGDGESTQEWSFVTGIRLWY